MSIIQHCAGGTRMSELITSKYHITQKLHLLEFSMSFSLNSSLNSENTKLFSLRYAYYDDVGDLELVKGYNSVVLEGVGEGNVVLREGRPRGVDFDQGASIIINDDIDKASHAKIFSSYSRRSFNSTVTVLGITVSYFKAKWKVRPRARFILACIVFNISDIMTPVSIR